MKTTSDSTKRSASLLAAVLFSQSAAAQVQSDPQPAGDREPVASDPANPESEPLEDKSKRANPESEPVEDRAKKAGSDARPVEDKDEQRANEEAEEVKDNGKTAGDEARPLKDGKPSTANDESRPVEDEDEDQASQEGAPVEDKKPAKAGAPAERVEDESKRANRKAGDVEDGDKEKANPAPRRGAGRKEPNRGAERGRPDGDPTPAEEEAKEVAKQQPDEMPASEPPLDAAPEAKEAEAAVKKATEEAETELASRKLEIRGESEARGLIDDILGKESSISRAEIDRERRVGARRQDRREDRGQASQPEAGREQLAEATLYLRQRLQGEVDVREAPAFFRQTRSVEERGELRPGEARGTRRDRIVAPQPRYFHEGRRYVHFDSRESIPAILLATAALDRVKVQPAREVRQNFFDGSPPEGASLPPEEYRGDGAWVVSYPVSEKSMVSSNDILFRQGSTQFADGHSYDMVLALSDALGDPALARARFVVEGHASAEGSYADNMELSQRRAEAIVREMVRGGISPDRLVPVGYGESEARSAADAPEGQRREDRRVVMFRMDEPAAANR